MELFLRPLADVNDVTWSIIWCLIILLEGVEILYRLYNALGLELNDGDLTNKDAEQDTKIAVMDSTLEDAIRRIEMVHSRIDKTEEQIKEIEASHRQQDLDSKNPLSLVQQ